MSSAQRPGLGAGYDPLAAILDAPPVPAVEPDPNPEPAPRGMASTVGERTKSQRAITTAPSRQHPAIAPPPEVRRARHKLTTYLPRSLYEWVAGEVEEAQHEGYAASIADVVRTALERLRASDQEELRRRLRGQ